MSGDSLYGLFAGDTRRLDTLAEERAAERRRDEERMAMLRQQQSRFLLLHSPLVGPSTLQPLASVLEQRGHLVLLPDLRGVVHDPTPEWLVDAAVAAADGGDVVVAHSGAGAILPLVARRVDARAAVFLDAVLPDDSARAHVAPAGQRRLLEQHVDGAGLLRPWLDWWPADAVAELLPDPQQRAALAAELPRLPLSFYDHDVALPREWVPSVFVSLEGAYDEELREARRRGWPTTELGLSHLAPATAPEPVADALLALVDELWGPG